MKQSIYSIFDTVAEMFNKPFAHHNDGTAVRDFDQGMSDNPNKNDFVLYKIGEFTDHDGAIAPVSAPIKIKTGFEVGNENTETPAALKKQAS
jgi:hypothetical protein